jgi:hypothetical protein
MRRLVAYEMVKIKNTTANAMARVVRPDGGRGNRHAVVVCGATASAGFRAGEGGRLSGLRVRARPRPGPAPGRAVDRGPDATFAA